MNEGVERPTKPATKRQTAQYLAKIKAGDPILFVRFIERHHHVSFNDAYEGLDGVGQDWVVEAMKNHLGAS